jgi:predicted GIY-YIG superfamily endonuclease
MLTSLYRFYDATGALLYIGITNSIPRRLGEHDERKPWFANAVRATFEHHPSRAAALTAEKKAIKKEQPRYNIVHNHGREVVQSKPAKGGQWVFRSRESNWEKRANLFLYPELECSSMVDNVHYLDSEGQFEEYVQYLERRYPEWLDADAVPIIWSVRSRDSVDSIYETAPFQKFDPSWGDFLTHFTWPVDTKTGEHLDWFRLPVVNERFPEFAEALAWMPSPLQPTCPLRSILASRSARTTA